LKEGGNVDYTELANQLIIHFNEIRKNQHQKAIDETMGGEAFALLYSWKKSGYVQPSEMSGKMSVSSARMAVILNRLEAKGLITRQIDKVDRRKILVSLTPAGKEAAGAYSKKALSGAVNMLEMLGEQDAKEFVRILGRLADFTP